VSRLQEHSRARLWKASANKRQLSTIPNSLAERILASIAASKSAWDKQPNCVKEMWVDLSQMVNHSCNHLLALISAFDLVVNVGMGLPGG
jgi:hypothetical protein